MVWERRWGGERSYYKGAAELLQGGSRVITRGRHSYYKVSLLLFPCDSNDIPPCLAKYYKLAMQIIILDLTQSLLRHLQRI